MQVLLIGIDAACSDVLAPLFDDDHLPALKRLVDDGVSGPLESAVPPWTPSMWPSLYTGTNPGKHGVFSFLSYDGYDWDLVNATHVREHSIWELLDEHDRSSVIVNVPVTHPPREFNGALIPGYTAPENPTGHPDGILDEVKRAIGGYRVYAPHVEDPDEALEQYRELTSMRGAAFRYLCDQYDPDFGFIQFQQTDTVYHEHPGDHHLVRGIYETVDQEIEATLEHTTPETVFVASDHGIGKYHGYGFSVNTFLKDHGYVVSKTGGRGMPSWAPIRDNQLRYGTDTHTDTDHPSSPTVATRGIALAAQLGITTTKIGTLLDRLGLRTIVAKHVPDTLIRSGQPQVDFERSTAYMRARIELGVRINLAGREPNGIVPADEYDTVRADLIDLLKRVETPLGEPVFEEVALREAYFVGPQADRAVDIITIPANYEHFLTADLLDTQFTEPGQPWNHKRTGMFIAAGEQIRTPTTTPNAHIYDVAPTILAAFGLPASDRMDGTVLPFVNPNGTMTYPAPRARSRDSYSDDVVVDRLQDLGYLESS